MSIRPPAVAGSFYPSDAGNLASILRELLYERVAPPDRVRPKGLIVPHAGYQYSGQVAAMAYQLLTQWANRIAHVVILGPCHRVPVQGVAVPSVTQFRTPLGDVRLNQAGMERLIALDFVGYNDRAHAQEHSIEVQLPFLQSVLPKFDILPILVGECHPKDVSTALECIWGAEETVIVVSTDLSHFLSYDDACRRDAATVNKIVQAKATIGDEEACGCRPLNGLLLHASSIAMEIHLLMLLNSGDTAGSKDRVVGYGSLAMYISREQTR